MRLHPRVHVRSPVSKVLETRSISVLPSTLYKLIVIGVFRLTDEAMSMVPCGPERIEKLSLLFFRKFPGCTATGGGLRDSMTALVFGTVTLSVLPFML